MKRQLINAKQNIFFINLRKPNLNVQKTRRFYQKKINAISVNLLTSLSKNQP